MSEKYFFLHLHKTAGTALWNRLQHAFSERELYPAPGDGTKPNETLVVEDMVAVYERRGHEIRVVTGHFPLCSTELLGGGFRTFTVLRDPVERVLSAIRQHRQAHQLEADLEKIYEEPLRQLMVRNHMTKMLSLTVDEMTDGCLTDVEFTDERLARAKAALATIDVVGFQDDFDDFCERLAAEFGWDLGRRRVANRTQPMEVSETFRARIAADNASDIALYEFATTLAR